MKRSRWSDFCRNNDIERKCAIDNKKIIWSIKINIRCGLISLKIQQLIRILIFSLSTPESNLFCDYRRPYFARSLRKTNKKQNYLMWGQISSPFTTYHNGIIKNVNQFHLVCSPKRLVYQIDRDLISSWSASECCRVKWVMSFSLSLSLLLA